MRRLIWSGAVLALLGGAVAASRAQVARPAATSKADRPITIDALIDIRHPSAPQWSPDGRRLLFTWERAGVASTFIVDADGRSAPRQLQLDGGVGASWTPDGQALYVSRNGDLWRVPLDGGTPAAVWTTPVPESGIVFSPDNSAVAFVRSAARAIPATASGRGGGSDAPSDIWTRRLADGAETRIASLEGGVAGLSWSPDGKHLAFSSGAGTIRHDQTPAYSGAKIIYTITERTPGQTYVVDAAGTAPPVPLSGVGGNARWMTPSQLLFDRTSADFKSRTINIASIGGGTPRVAYEDRDDRFWSITGDAGAGSQLSPDGKWILFVCDRDGWDHLYVMPAAGGTPVQITKGAFEAWRPTWARDSRRIAFDANAPGKPGTRHLGVADLGTDPAHATVTMITSGSGTNIAPRWSPDGTRLVYQHTDARNSADLFVVDAKAGATPVRLTDSMPASIDKSSLVEPQLVHYAGPDGQQVPAWLFLPKNLDRSRKHPAIVWIHGDGVNQNYDGWHVQRNYAVYYSIHQYLLQQGYVVIAPDYRGSIGYGRAWRQGVYMDVGGNDAKDAWMVTNYLKTLPYVDMERIGVWGLSYGGFFTLIAMTDQPTMFRCGIDVAGVVDYAMYYEDPYHGGWTASRIGTPEQNPEVYAKASPLSHVDRLARPLLILHGTADVNVPYLHSVRFIDAALREGKGSLLQFMTYPGEFHYFTREHVLRDAWTRATAFFDEHLRGAAGAAQAD
jgi:dipeptidyl aminopeptidase/acylaminoacyl peptidase